MNRRERFILNAATGDSSPRLTIRTNTRIDTGSWWRRAAVWLCITDKDIVIFAAGRRQYLHQLPITACQNSHYCHTTGELVIAGGEELRFNRLAMPPTEGLRVLDVLSQSANLRSEQGTTTNNA